MIVVYESSSEMIICTTETEEKVLENFFDDKNERSIDDYDRRTVESYVTIESGMKVRWYD